MNTQEQIIFNTANRLLAGTKTAAICIDLSDGKSAYLGDDAGVMRMLQNKDQSGAAVRGEAVAGLPARRFVHVSGFLDADYIDFKAGAIFGGGVLNGVEYESKHYTRTVAEEFVAEGDWREVEVSARAADAPSEPSEPQQKTIDCMDAWATSMQMPTYSELQALTEQYDALIRKICFQYAAGGYNSDGFMAPKSADLKLRWIIDEAYRSPSRAADALDSQPTELPPLPESDWTLAGSANNRDAYTADQMREYGRLCASSQPTDGGVRNG